VKDEAMDRRRNDAPRGDILRASGNASYMQGITGWWPVSPVPKSPHSTTYYATRRGRIVRAPRRSARPLRVNCLYVAAIAVALGAAAFVRWLVGAA
jgi:hypothetical protein